jgi:hypothetical protein
VASSGGGEGNRVTQPGGATKYQNLHAAS